MTWGTWQHAHSRFLVRLVLLEYDTVTLRAYPRQHLRLDLLMENASRQQAQEECAHDDGERKQAAGARRVRPR